MKVALINNFPPYSGTGKVAYELFRSLQTLEAQGVSADLYCTHFMRAEEATWAVNRGVKFLHNFAYKDNETLSRLLIYFADPHRIPKRYDIYHITNHMLGRFTLSLHPCVVTVHDVLQFQYRERMSNRLSSSIYNFLMDQSLKALKRADHLIAVSAWSANQVASILSIPREKISVVYNGLDHALFYPRDKYESRRRLNLPPDAKIVLNVGSEIRRKNLRTLLVSMRRVVDKIPTALLLRLGERTKEMERLVEELALSHNVIYLNFVEDSEVPFVYSSADLTAIVSFEEGFGFAVVESQACGIPVISSRRSSLPEVAGPDSLFIENPEDPEILSDIIVDVLGMNKGRLVSLTYKGIENSKRFTWEGNAEQTLDVYERVLGIDGRL